MKSKGGRISPLDAGSAISILEKMRSEAAIDSRAHMERFSCGNANGQGMDALHEREILILFSFAPFSGSGAVRFFTEMRRKNEKTIDKAGEKTV